MSGPTYLQLNASGRETGSVSRQLMSQLHMRILAAAPEAVLINRDIGMHPPSIVGPEWIDANTTAQDERTQDQKNALTESDALIAELRKADVLLIGLPIYNFHFPASFKAWIDQVCRARETFRFAEDGPVGLLEGKRAIVIITSGGTGLGSSIDFVTGYLKHILGFIGIKDVEILAADRLLFDTEMRLADVTRLADTVSLNPSFNVGSS